jgi:hypothetical protein
MVLYQAIRIEFREPVSELKVIEIAGRLRYFLIELEKRIAATIKNINNLSFMDKTGGAALMAGKLKLIQLNIDKVIFFEKMDPKTLRFSWPHGDMDVMPIQISGQRVALKKVMDEGKMEKMIEGMLDESGFNRKEYNTGIITYEREVTVE